MDPHPLEPPQGAAGRLGLGPGPHPNQDRQACWAPHRGSWGAGGLSGGLQEAVRRRAQRLGPAPIQGHAAAARWCQESLVTPGRGCWTHRGSLGPGGPRGLPGAAAGRRQGRAGFSILLEGRGPHSSNGSSPGLSSKVATPTLAQGTSKPRPVRLKVRGRDPVPGAAPQAAHTGPGAGHLLSLPSGPSARLSPAWHTGQPQDREWPPSLRLQPPLRWALPRCSDLPRGLQEAGPAPSQHVVTWGPVQPQTAWPLVGAHHLPTQGAHSTCPPLPRCHCTRSAAAEAGTGGRGGYGQRGRLGRGGGQSAGPDGPGRTQPGSPWPSCSGGPGPWPASPA